jgi:pyridoxal biosynthesis lyase PdxS
MNLPTTEDLHRIAEGISMMRVQIEAMRGYLEGVERVVTLQEKWRKSVDETMQRLFARQEEGQKSFQAWTKTVEDRLRDLQRFWEEGTKRWAEGLTEAVSLGQISHRSLEELGKAVSDISKLVFRQGPAASEAKENPPKPSQRKVKAPPET